MSMNGDIHDSTFRTVRAEVVIPARLASTRLPEKMLLAETGKPLIQHTYESALKATKPVGVTVAVDHPRVFQAVSGFGGKVLMTDPNAASGTDRVAEVARTRSDIDAIINVQGDEPEMDPTAIDLCIDLLEKNPQAAIATLATPIRTRTNLEDPACVKVILNHQGEAIYFSRSVIPHPRTWDDQLLSKSPPVYLQHLGIYGYRRDFLLSIDQVPPSPLEETEKLEQLRFLQAGYSIVVGVIQHAPRGIDTRNDYEAFVRRQRGW
jgi:3-deoxy-manno-octulosonate cytidylyltransferase (CMP-KDO synthetase)